MISDEFCRHMNLLKLGYSLKQQKVTWVNFCQDNLLRNHPACSLYMYTVSLSENIFLSIYFSIKSINFFSVKFEYVSFLFKSLSVLLFLPCPCCCCCCCCVPFLFSYKRLSMPEKPWLVHSPISSRLSPATLVLP